VKLIAIVASLMMYRCSQGGSYLKAPQIKIATQPKSCI
jgi:hypothetical protein